MNKTAYSYVRFSSKEQAKGASLVRQLEKSRAYAAAKGLTLDETMQDEGVAAYKGENVKTGHLGRFLGLVRNGTIKPGCVLIVENLDRLSRQAPLKAFTQFTEIIEAGVLVMTLTDGQTYSTESITENPMQLFGSLAVMIRANEESATKGKRVGDAWARKRGRAKQGEKMTQKLPYWVEYTGPDKKAYKLNAERAAVIRRIFKMTIAGNGVGSIERILNKEKVPPFLNKSWAKSYLNRIVTSRTIIGEYQPMKGGEKDGPAIPNYYPAAVDEKTYLAAQAARAVRKLDNGGNTPGHSHMNLFSHIVECGLCGGSVHYVTKDKKHDWRYLVCANSRNGVGCKCKAWRYSSFEKAVLRWVIQPHFNSGADAGAIEELNAERLAAQGKATEAARKASNLMGSIALTDSEAMRRALLKRAETSQREAEEAEAAAVVAQNALALEEERLTSLRAGTATLEKLIEHASVTENRLKLREEIRRRVGKIVMFPEFLRVGPTAERSIDIRSETAATVPVEGKKTRVIIPVNYGM
jgi:DNA invertase Pin-like site-specific DNA recombinase